jgi:hypothetical protein
VVRHDHGPKRAIRTGIEPVAVQPLKDSDCGDEPVGEQISYTSASLLRWAGALPAWMPYIAVVPVQHLGHADRLSG